MVLMVGNSDLKRIDTMISWKYLKKIGLVTFNLGKKKNSSDVRIQGHFLNLSFGINCGTNYLKLGTK